MTGEASAPAVRRQLRELGDPDVAAHSRRFFKTGAGEYGEGDRFLGIRVPVVRKLIKEYRELPLEQVRSLLGSPYHEERLFAALMLVDKFSRGGDAERKSIYELYLANTRCINSWDIVDGSASGIVGAYLVDKDRGPIHRLSRSLNLWERRIAVMATFHFIKLGQFSDTLRIARALLDDDHDLIHKAVGWMLREVGNRDRAAEERFLAKHYGKMPRTMLRYAIEKFPQRQRQAYLKGTARSGG